MKKKQVLRNSSLNEIGKKIVVGFIEAKVLSNYNFKKEFFVKNHKKLIGKWSIWLESW